MLGYTTTMVMVTVWFYHMMGTCVKLLSLEIFLSETTILLQAEIQSYPLSTSVVQNKG